MPARIDYFDQSKSTHCSRSMVIIYGNHKIIPSHTCSPPALLYRCDISFLFHCGNTYDLNNNCKRLYTYHIGKGSPRILGQEVNILNFLALERNRSKASIQNIILSKIKINNRFKLSFQ